MNFQDLLLVVVSLFWSPALSLSTEVFSVDPDETLTFSELVSSRGYVLQEHHVLTPDGYILTVHRVVPPDFDPATYNLYRKPVLLMHGIFSDAALFFVNSPHLGSNSSFCGDNFGFCLVRSGRYDVWAANSRGNGRSDRHLRYTKADADFWKFSWDHMAVYDLPAVLDLVLTRTGHRTLSYVAYSQGCSQMFALLSLQPEYAKLLDIFISWAPAVFFGRATSLIGEPLRQFYPITMKPGPFLIGNPALNYLQQWYVCRPKAGKVACATLMEQLFGQSNLNLTRIPTYAAFGPSPSSNWQVAHYGQTGRSGRFQRFDYRDTKSNLLAYGQASAPDYPLKRVPRDLKIVIFYGATDTVIVPQDVKMLISILRRNGNNLSAHRVASPRWSHVDFMLGLNSGPLLNDPSLAYLDLYAWGNRDWKKRKGRLG